MATGEQSTHATVPQLMRTVKQLSAAELSEFKRRFAEWQEKGGGQQQEDSGLIEACRARLPPNEERRLRRLITKSERGVLGQRELEAYRDLMRRAETLDATRLAALTQLARRWGKPVQAVMETIGWETGEDETASHPTRLENKGARPRG